jgi:microcystin-dependent protein
MSFRVSSINNKGAAVISGSNVVTTGMTDKDHMHVEENFIRNAGVINEDDFEVSQRAAGVDRSVDVAAGVAYVLNHSWSLNSAAQARYWQALNSAVYNVPLTTNTSGNPRIDIICIEIDTSAPPGETGGGAMDIIVVEGTPASSPVAPAVPDDCLLLAEVAVANGYTSITDANITDRRMPSILGGDAGDIKITAKETAPWGWLLCDGSAISRTIYADLFAAIGTAFGDGDGSTTFNLPNMKGKVPVGLNSSETEFDTLGETGGEKTHLLTGLESGVKPHDHTVKLAEGSGGSSYKVAQATANLSNSLGGNFGGTVNATAQNATNAHNNLQPYIVLNYVIKI